LPFLAARPVLFGGGCFGTGGAEKEKVGAVSGFPAGLFFFLPVFFPSCSRRGKTPAPPGIRPGRKSKMISFGALRLNGAWKYVEFKD
jgi:hypothetical protein